MQDAVSQTSNGGQSASQPTRIGKRKFTNPEAVFHGGSYGMSISWHTPDARFHVWLMDDGTVKDNKVYKNSHAGYREPGHFNCRYLKAEAHRKTIDAVLALVDQDEARRVYAEKEAAEQHQRELDTIAHQQRERAKAAAPEVLRIVAMLETFMLNGSDRIHFSALMPDSETETLGSVIQAAVRKMTV